MAIGVPSERLSSRFGQNLIDMEYHELVQQVDIVEYIKRYVDLEMKSNGEWWGLSPFTNEKTPSFSVSSNKQVFYDFSSGANGDIIEFIKKYHHCNFYKAVNILCEENGIKNELDSHTRLTSVNVAKRYRSSGKRSKPLANPKPYPSDYMVRFQWDEEKLRPWANEGITYEVMKENGVAYDPLSQRIVYPIYNSQGEIVNIHGRTIDPSYKEKQLPKYIYYQKWGGAMDIIYGLYQHRLEIEAKKEIILFEGAKSCFKAEGWGIKNTGAIMTSHLSYPQFKVLLELGVRVVFALDEDADPCGDTNIAKLSRYLRVEYIKDGNGLLGPKMAPVDEGKAVFDMLYQSRQKI